MVKPVPFPLPLSVGTDICSIESIRAIMKRQNSRFPQSFVHKLLTPPERSDYHARVEVRGAAAGIEFLAGRWAAKEAIIKAHAARRLTFHDITIRQAIVPRDNILKDHHESPDAAHAPVLPRGPVAEIRFSQAPDEPAREVPVSISHHVDYATAVCLGVDLEAARRAGPGSTFYDYAVGSAPAKTNTTERSRETNGRTKDKASSKLEAEH